MNGIFLAWACLSFDVINEEGEGNMQYPATCSIVGGTQAAKATRNELIVMKLTNLNISQSEYKTELCFRNLRT